MMTDERRTAHHGIPSPLAAEVHPQKNGLHLPAKTALDNFGLLTFDKRAMSRYLPKSVYDKLIDTICNNTKLDMEIADEVAHAMKEWAVGMGATHFCHWFQPVRGETAEKHDSFLSFDGIGQPIQRFSGRRLIQGEPDASSFPSGGMRSTFEARGYTAWDPTSPAFLLKTGRAATLVIPSVFLSWTGEVLDMKTPLLRALEAVEDRAFRLLKLFGNRSAKHVRMTIGTEQEYFLVSKELHHRRPDLIHAGRTLFGAMPARHQQMEDHYFGSIKPKVLEFMSDLDGALYERGIPAKTRHNEVAPNQFELAPLYEEANLAVDHNLQTMEIMRKVADDHGFAILLHEKPFAGVNGSGKHLNFSLGDSDGNNLLDPGTTPKRNLQFLTFLAAILTGVEKFGGLLRAAVAEAGNDHRLGANEAPPAVMSVYLGEHLSGLLEEIEKGAKGAATSPEALDHGLKQLPRILLDNSDRNRTSPIAFTGDKFEFRAVGASMNCSEPTTTMALLMAYGIDRMIELIEKKPGEDIAEKALAAVREAAAKTKRIRFEGNNYEGSWLKEAERRGLPNYRNTPEALELLTTKEVVSLYERYKVLREGELHAKQEIRLETYVKIQEIELRTLREMTTTYVAPALVQHLTEFGQGLEALKSAQARAGAPELQKRLQEAGGLLGELYSASDEVGRVLERSGDCEDTLKRAHYLADHGVKALAKLRDVCDRAEEAVDHRLWPVPKYREMLFAL